MNSQHLNLHMAAAAAIFACIYASNITQRSQSDFWRVAAQKLMRYQGVTICEELPCAVGGPAGKARTEKWGRI
jgi:hypothetical protein